MEGDLPKKELFKEGVSPSNTLMGSLLVRATRGITKYGKGLPEKESFDMRCPWTRGAWDFHPHVSMCSP